MLLSKWVASDFFTQVFCDGDLNNKNIFIFQKYRVYWCVVLVIFLAAGATSGVISAATATPIVAIPGPTTTA